MPDFGGDYFMSFSIRHLLGRGSAKAPARDSDPRLAQELVDRGIAAETSGASVVAMRCFRNAIEADDRFAPAHMNLGIALHAAGELAPAIASYERAIAIDPEYASAHYNLALTHLLHSQYSEAELGFRTALLHRNDFPEAWVGLADTLEACGRDEEALGALDKAIALRSDYVGALLNATALLQKSGQIEKAVARCRRALELEPQNHLAQFRLATGLHNLGQLPEAEVSYRRALVLKPDYSEAKTNLALILQEDGRIQEALRLLFELVASEPTNAELRGILAEVLLGVELKWVGNKEREILVGLCHDDNVSMRFLNRAIITLLKSGRDVQILSESAQRGEDPLSPAVPEVAAFLRDPLLLAALPRMPMADAVLEEALTHIRRCILLRFDIESGITGADPVVPSEFICSLARQCFFSAYAFFADEHELQRVASLREALEAKLRQPAMSPEALEASLAIVSLYDSLLTLKGYDRLLEHPMSDWSEAFQPIVQEQIIDRVREREIAKQLTSIGPIDDAISLAVRAQYELNPYPRWVSVPSPRPETIEQLASRLHPGQDIRPRPRPVRILIAGCGTGHHSIQVARNYPDSEILAVDLSLASLAYAARMTERFGISNITYRQADILNLGNLDTRFALIECGGVLHHLEDPMAGWRVLVKLLEPDGLMKIALYSEKARGSIGAAREFARSMASPLTTDGIRACRHAILRLPEGHPAKAVMDSNDFFTIDEFRDLVVHVQEHQFTMPRIASCLDELGLRFLGMECARATRRRFRAMFPDGEALTKLEAWHQFEEIYPRTFEAMYTFWSCRQ